MLRAGMHFQVGELDSVVECCQRILLFDDKHTGAYFSLGLALHSLKRLPEAEAAYSAAFRIDPGHTKVVTQLTQLLMEQDRLADIGELLEAAIAHAPQDALLRYNLGLVFMKLGDDDAALRILETAIRINPRLSEAHVQMGLVHSGRNQYDAAIASLVCAMSLDTGNLNIVLRLALTYVEAGRLTEAIAVYERIIAAHPVDTDAHTALGICRLLLGDFRGGWPEYEWRLRTPYMAVPPTAVPRWKGEPLAGKTILLLAEQGFGDAVQFIRYAREIKARGATVILGCRPALSRLLAECEGVDHVVNEGDTAPPFNVEITLLSLPGVLGTTLETIPADVPYIRVPSGAGARAVAEIACCTGVLRVGLVWAGGFHTGSRHRNMVLQQFRDLLDIPGIKFFSLQKGEEAAQLADVDSELITDLAPYLGDFADTAAAIQTLDLVISVDTAVAHVAGALAKPVWTLIPFAPDWRWLLNRNDSPWYPTMRLFRQPAPGHWSSVIAHIAVQLTALVQEQTTTGKTVITDQISLRHFPPY
ncbi:MAG: tetratricopeptide repeat protein [Sulfuricaulis sp.]